MERFEKFKEEILERAKAAGICKGEYARALEAESFGSLMVVVRDIFHWAVCESVIDGAFIDAWQEEFAEAKIWHNCNADSGYPLVDNATVEACGNVTVEACGNATVKACGNATVKACGNATVKAWGNATVEACGNVTVKAWGNATVKAWGNAYITSYDVIECELRDHAIYRIRRTNTVRYADKDIKFQLVEE